MRIAIAVVQLVFLGLFAGEGWTLGSDAARRAHPGDDPIVVVGHSGTTRATLPGVDLLGIGPAHLALVVRERRFLLSESGLILAAVGAVHRVVPLLHQAPKLSPPA